MAKYVLRCLCIICAVLHLRLSLSLYWMYSTVKHLNNFNSFVASFSYDIESEYISFFFDVPLLACL